MRLPTPVSAKDDDQVEEPADVARGRERVAVGAPHGATDQLERLGVVVLRHPLRMTLSQMVEVGAWISELEVQ